MAAGFPGGIAQLGEHLPCKQGVKGSNPFISTVIRKRMTNKEEPDGAQKETPDGVQVINTSCLRQCSLKTTH